jgi:hypothetical protein
MNRKRVLLLHRPNDHYRRLTGWWSYPVDQFYWQERVIAADDFRADLGVSAHGYDLAVLDDWTFGYFKNRTLPLAYVIVDSARSVEQFRRNVFQGAQADLLLVDSDDLGKFGGLGKPVQRFAYAVNERLFYPRPKDYDVAFLCWPTPERRIVQAHCAAICERHGWRFLTGTYDAAEDYARAIGSAKVVVHAAHVKAARSWRVFDVLASQGCLLSSPLPAVSGDGLVAGVHYHEYKSSGDLEIMLENLLHGSVWESAATNGHRHVMANHVWSVRARQLQTQLAEVFAWA